MLAPLLARSAVIIPAGGRFSAKSFWKDACHFGATFYTAVPTMHQVPSLYHCVIVRPVCALNIMSHASKLGPSPFSQNLGHLHRLLGDFVGSMVLHHAGLGSYVEQTIVYRLIALHTLARTYSALCLQILLSRAQEDYPRDRPPPLRFIRSCSSSLAAPTLHKLEASFKVPVLEVQLSEQPGLDDVQYVH